MRGMVIRHQTSGYGAPAIALPTWREKAPEHPRDDE